MIKCVVFDFDGTLVDSNDIKRETFFTITQPWDACGDVVAEVFERWPAADRYEKTRKIAEELIRRGLLPAGASAESWGERLANDYTAYCESAITGSAERPGASQALMELSGMGMQLFVNSGRRHDHCSGYWSCAIGRISFKEFMVQRARKQRTSRVLPSSQGRSGTRLSMSATRLMTGVEPSSSAATLLA